VVRVRHGLRGGHLLIVTRRLGFFYRKALGLEERIAMKCRAQDLQYILRIRGNNQLKMNTRDDRLKAGM
jgi:hypothetical protein